MNQTGITTELEQDEDGLQKITTEVRLQHGSSIMIESTWKSDQAESVSENTGTSIHIGDFSVSLPNAPALLAHANMIQMTHESSIGNLPKTDAVEPAREDVKTVYMGTRHDGVEVFLDSLTAALWAGSRERVKEVSLRTAAFVLKADPESVKNSAAKASRRTREIIDVIRSIVSLTEYLCDRISDMGISIEALDAI
jgi:hypothetical protein